MFVILEDVLPEPILNRLSGLVTENPNFNFGAVKTALSTDEVKSFTTEPSSGWEMEFFSLPIIMATFKLKIQIHELMRIRFGILHRDIEQIVNTPHIDNPQNHHYVGLYYLNDTDGATKIWKQTHKKWGERAEYFTVEDCELMEEISPKVNRMVIFDGSHYHSSMLPTKTQLRYVINYNFNIIEDI